MKLQNRFKLFILILSLFNKGAEVYAQSAFKYKAPLPKIDSSGFYLIKLSPSDVAKCQTSLADLRIGFGKEIFVPFINAANLPKKEKNTFVAFPKVVYKLKRDTGTTYVVHNEQALTIDQLVLTLRNTAVSRTVNISGSDDLNDWYALKENIPLESAGSGKQGSYEQKLNFPASNYKYFKVLVNDKDKIPVKILQARTEILPSIKQTYTIIPQPVVKQRDSNKVSYVTVTFKEAYQLDKIQLILDGPKYFKRRIKVIQELKGKYSLVLNSEINALQTIPTLYFNSLTKRLLIEIHNEDNTPLLVKEVKPYQLTKSLITYLEKGKEYSLYFGNDSIGKPIYDLNFFSDKIQNKPVIIEVTKVLANPDYSLVKIDKKSKNNWLIWVAIATALVLLSLITLRMVKEIKTKA